MDDKSIMERVHDAVPYMNAVGQRYDAEGKLCCYYCGVVLGDKQADHILPIRWGGPDVVYNVVWACKSCNSGKRDKHPLVWYGIRDIPDDMAIDFIVRLLCSCAEAARLGAHARVAKSSTDALEKSIADVVGMAIAKWRIDMENEQEVVQ